MVSERRKQLIDALAASPFGDEDSLRNILRLFQDETIRPSFKSFLEDGALLAADAPDVGDYITDFAERREILAEWDLKRPRSEYFTPAAIGIFMVAPLDTLRDLTRTLREDPDPDFRTWFMKVLHDDAAHAIRSYLPKGAKKSSARSAATEACMNRDGDVCIIAGTSDPIASHIFPPSSGTEETSYLRSILKTLWGKERAAEWIGKFTDRDFVESQQNMIALNHGLNFLFHEARFAFKPLPSDNPNERPLQFHWLKPSLFRTLREELRGDPLELPGLDDDSIQTWGTGVAQRPSGWPVETGQIFTIRAENPDDLPDWDMLQMQWDLHRAVAIAGAGAAEGCHVGL